MADLRQHINLAFYDALESKQKSKFLQNLLSTPGITLDIIATDLGIAKKRQ